MGPRCMTRRRRPPACPKCSRDRPGTTPSCRSSCKRAGTCPPSTGIGRCGARTAHPSRRSNKHPRTSRPPCRSGRSCRKRRPSGTCSKEPGKRRSTCTAPMGTQPSSRTSSKPRESGCRASRTPTPPGGTCPERPTYPQSRADERPPCKRRGTGPRICSLRSTGARSSRRRRSTWTPCTPRPPRRKRPALSSRRGTPPRRRPRRPRYGPG
mmetsp:Transcript_104507/g.302407  ORF Transcript_104507/g.302407 Transcript_104507/m.302407 type:complete len:210 (-) Transcript_104507:231-860(-)